jgi:hypothetical protein
MGPRRTAVNTLSYSTGSRSKAEEGRVSAKTIATGICDVHAAPGPATGRGWTSGGQGRSAAVGRPPKLSSTPNQPHRGPADRQGDQDVVGSHLVTTFVSLRLRVAQLGSRNITSVPACLSDPMFDGSLNAISRGKAQGS